MNKKKILTLLVTTTLIAVVGVGSTLAYFTDKTETLTNVVTMGKVNARLVENDAIRGEDGIWEFTDNIIPSFWKDKGNYWDVLPGDIVKKNPTVCLEPGSADAWVRVSFNINGDKDKWLDNSIETPNTELKVVAPEINSEVDTFRKLIEEAIKDNIIKSGKWKYDGSQYYYYLYKLQAPRWLGNNYIKYLYSGDEDTPATKATLFDQFIFPTMIDNNAASKAFNIEVNAELIQADHITFINDENNLGWYGVGEDNTLGEQITPEMIQPYPLNGTGTGWPFPGWPLPGGWNSNF